MFQVCKMNSKHLTYPCIHLTHHTPLSCGRLGRMWWIIRHRDVEEPVGATDFSTSLWRDIVLPCLCRVAARGLCWLCACDIRSILH